MSNKLDKKIEDITEEDLSVCWEHHLSYFKEILTGEYDLEEARRDLLSLIGSKNDSRVK